MLEKGMASPHDKEQKAAAVHLYSAMLTESSTSAQKGGIVLYKLWEK